MINRLKINRDADSLKAKTIITITAIDMPKIEKDEPPYPQQTYASINIDLDAISRAYDPGQYVLEQINLLLNDIKLIKNPGESTPLSEEIQKIAVICGELSLSGTGIGQYRATYPAWSEAGKPETTEFIEPSRVEGIFETIYLRLKQTESYKPLAAALEERDTAWHEYSRMHNRLTDENSKLRLQIYKYQTFLRHFIEVNEARLHGKNYSADKGFEHLDHMRQWLKLVEEKI